MKTFVQTLGEIRDGDLAVELSSRVLELVAAVRATDKGGSLTLKLTVKPLRQGIGMLQIEDDVKLVLPQPDRETVTLMFTTDDNELTRRDPRQPKLPEMGVVRSMSEAGRTADSNG